MSCPICKKTTDPDVRPFCSKRCADVDLSRWLNGRYVVAGEDGDAGDEAHAGRDLAPEDPTSSLDDRDDPPDQA